MGLTQEATVDPRNTGGEEFLTAFLQNSQLGYSTASLCVFISSLSESTTSVTVLSQADGTSQKVTGRCGESAVASISQG
ncbi:hypothetical protein U0070_009086 [Myodes glareolus]|uniref:Uncharacterized protein n=1 Tax=Myodes glareolus TaxID=447135 RepID=A0AAW0H5L2_MYOGA